MTIRSGAAPNAYWESSDDSAPAIALGIVIALAARAEVTLLDDTTGA